MRTYGERVFTAIHPTEGTVEFTFQEYFDYMEYLHYPWPKTAKGLRTAITNAIDSLQNSADLRLAVYLGILQWRQTKRH